MAYSLNKLIANAYFLSKVRSKDFQTVGGDDIEVGIDLLNEILSESSVNTKMIPYYSEYDFNAVQGQEEYFIPNLVEATSLTFNLGPVRYATNNKSRRAFHSTSRVDGILSLPFDCSFERCLGGMNMYVYFLPTENYPFKVWGKFSLLQVTSADLQTDLTETYDVFLIKYLRYALAREICAYFGVSFNPEAMDILQKISLEINDLNYIDMTPKTRNFYQEKTALNWAQINIGKGWTPG